MEYELPFWLQKELDQLGVFTHKTFVVTTMNKSKRYDSVGWKPSYLGEEPPY